MGRFNPFARHHSVHVFEAFGVVIKIATPNRYELSQLTVHHDHVCRFVGRELDGLIQQGLIGNAFAASQTCVCADDDLWVCIFNASSQRVRRKAAKNNGMNGAQADASQHGESSLSNHRHVNQHTIAFDHAQITQDGRHALHFSVQIAVGVGFFLVSFSRHKDQSGLIGTVFEVTIHCVVTQIGLAAHKPFGKRRIAVIADLLWRHIPVHQLGLLGPEGVTVIDRARVKVSKTGHVGLLTK